MGRYFGTDGFRGEAGVRLTADQAFRTGRFLGWYCRYKKYSGAFAVDSEDMYPTVPEGYEERCRIVIGEDTRRSGAMLGSAIAAGIMASGADVFLMGVTTTPSVSYITKEEGFDCGIMISASHNPYYDNGIKVINGDGSKLGDDDIKKIEKYLDSDTEMLPYAKRGEIGILSDYSRGKTIYEAYLSKTVLDGYMPAAGTSEKTYPGRIFSGMKIAIDCANGSASVSAERVFRALGADVCMMADMPDGFNINTGVGSTHMDAVSSFTVSNGCMIGFAYDGDADRCLAVDEHGEIINGDRLIYAAALDMKKRQLLKNNTVALTVMSNLGLLKALDSEGIKYEITAVGDRYVWECMSRGGYSLGGEQSGHIIFAGDLSTGDGILTSLKILDILKRSGKSASELFSGCRMYPQVLKNARTADKEKTMRHAETCRALAEAEKSLGDRGRILLRASGTEPLIRVMAEAPTYEECETAVDSIIDIMEKAGLLLRQS